MQDDHSPDNQSNDKTHLKEKRTFWGNRLNDKIEAGDVVKLLLVPILSSLLIQFVRFQIQSWPEVPATPISPASTSRSRVLPEAPLKALLPPTYTRLRLADNGSSFPTKSDYIQGYPRQHQGGYSSITIDNAQDNSDVFVKLFTLDSKPAKAVRVFFIRAHDKFTVKELSAGKYDIRYRDLASGSLSRTDALQLKENKTQKQIQYSTITLTLYRVKDGNMQIHNLSNQEF
jgi:hypothetical protein